MPQYTRNRPKLKYWVMLNQYLAYGYSGVDISKVSGVTQADLDLLGIGKFETFTPTNPIVIGSNSPKPTRVLKRITAGGIKRTFSTFCAYDKVQAAIQAGWQVAKQGRIRGLRDVAESTRVGVFIPIGGINYGFNMDRTDFNTYGTALGIQAVTGLTGAADIARLVFGASFPKPGMASIKLADGSTFSSFYDPTKLDDLKEWSKTLARA